MKTLFGTLVGVVLASVLPAVAADDSAVALTRWWQVRIPHQKKEIRQGSKMVASLHGARASGGTVPTKKTVTVHYSELEEVHATFVEYKGDLVTIRTTDGGNHRSTAGGHLTPFTGGQNSKFKYAAFSDADKEFLDWIRETSKHKNTAGQFEISRLSPVGTKGVLVGDFTIKSVVDETTVLVHQAYHTIRNGSPVGVRWDFKLLAPAKALGAGKRVSLPGFYKVKDRDLVQQIDEVEVVRAWRDAAGTHTTMGTLVSFEDGTVTLKKKDGATVSIPIEKLSKEDQEVVRKHSE